MMEFIGKCLYLKVDDGSGGRKKEKGILVVGDLHLGYEESLNRSGILVTRKMFEEMIKYFDSVFEELERREREDGKERKVNEVVLLGDVKHGFGKGNKQEWGEVLELFDYFIGKMNKGRGFGDGKIIVVKGNHDNYIVNIAGRRKVDVKYYYVVGDGKNKIAFLHGNRKVEEIEGKEINKWVMGHGHPAVRLKDEKTGKEEMYKCFLEGRWKGREIVIVPSFVDYKEGTDPREHDMKLAWKFSLNEFDVKIVSEDLKVLEFGALGKLK
jgi:uncharacterized protein